MKLTRQDRAALWSAFRRMRLREKVEYIFTYFRLPIFLTVAALAVVGSLVYQRVTRKEPVLYAAHINVSAGEDLEGRLGDGFVAALGRDPKRAEVYLYRALYLSDSPSQEDHQYSYASRLKVTSAIEAKQLDVALMDRKGYDILSHSGYLLPLSELLDGDPALRERLDPLLTANTVVLEDNAIEYQLGEADRYEAETREEVNALELSTLPLFDQAGFSQRVYLGVIANTPRADMALAYLSYLSSAPAEAAAEQEA